MCAQRFGGGTELLRDGDTEGLWDVVEQGLEWVSPHRDGVIY